jgi:hypothetical protein
MQRRFGKYALLLIFLLTFFPFVALASDVILPPAAPQSYDAGFFGLNGGFLRLIGGFFQLGTTNVTASNSTGGEVQVLGTQIGVGLTDTGASSTSNLALSTQSFTTVDWTPSQATVLDNQTAAPDGTVTAASFVETTASAFHLIEQGYAASPSTQYTFCGIIKKNLRTRVVLEAEDNVGAGGAYDGFDLSGGQVGVPAQTFGTGWVVATATPPTPEANGYYQVSLTFTTPSVIHPPDYIYFQFYPDKGSGTGAVNTLYAGTSSSPALYLWGTGVYTGASCAPYAQVTNNGLAATTLTSGNLNNFWGTQTLNAWVGVDAGAGNAPTWTRYRFAPRPGSTSQMPNVGLDYETLMQGDQVQDSGSPTFSSGVTTLDTIPTTPYYARFDLSERTLPPSSTARYIRILPNSNAFGSISELQFFAKRSTIGTAAAAPVTPTISPWGGRFPNGTTTVTLSSLTSEAQIYYTTDGSAPSNTHGTLYAGPFTYNIGAASTTLQAVAYDPTLSTTLSSVASATFEPWGFTPDDNWYDNNGNLVEAHSGGITYANGLYYWVGSIANKYSPPWPQQPTVANIIRTDVGVMMYSSPDLLNWTFVGNILPQPTGWNGTERAHILYNAANNDYVLWAHCLNTSNIGTADRACIATAPAITGPWTWVNTSLNPDGLGFKDNSLFLDSDGVTAYVVYTVGSQNGIEISQLSSNYQTTDGNTVALTATGREAPVLVKNSAGTYFLITSASNFYNSAGSMDLRYATSTGANPLSGWSALPGSQLMPSIPSGFNGQPSFVLVPQGKTEPFIGLDFWIAGSNFYGSRQTWVPLTFPTNTTVQATTPSTWNLSALN